jgi:prepilin-type N-terminal cleavage/methylation domain-containing protein
VKRSTTAGFSLTEMMVVLVIGSIMMAAAGPKFMALLRDAQIDSAANEIAVSMRGARAKAISQGNDFVWTYADSGNTYTAFDDDNENGTFDVGEAEYGPVALPAILTLSSSTIAGNSVTFQSLGNAAAGGVFEFEDGRGAVIMVTVEAATGNVVVSNRRAVAEDAS